MEVNIRPPLLFRVYAYAFGALWCGAGAYGLVRALPRASAAIPVFMLVFGATLCWRLSRLSAASEGDTLVVRNFYRTRRIQAAEITDLRTDMGPMQPIGRTVYVVTNSGAISVDAASMWSFRKRTEQSLAMLERWLHSRRANV